MSISVKSNPKIERAYMPTTALAKEVAFDDDLMHVFLTDGRIISVPIIWFPLLRRAAPEEWREYEIGGGGVSLHWPQLDEDISIAHLMGGVDQRWA
jgi:hypothetical protein